MATQRSQVYVCSICGNMVEVARAGAGTLVCCGVPMDHLTENTTDAAQEKHVPVVEKVDGGVQVTVGSVEHPMQDDHYIEWIEVSADGKTYRQYLNPGDKPQAVFPIEAEEVTAREVCNLHGLWAGK
jgi:superoxide reductase